MAGNIIPAIATANAMVASLVVFQAVNVLSGNVKACRTVYVRREPNHKGEILAPERDLLPPKPTCFICSSNPEVIFGFGSLYIRFLTPLITFSFCFRLR